MAVAELIPAGASDAPIPVSAVVDVPTVAAVVRAVVQPASWQT